MWDVWLTAGHAFVPIADLTELDLPSTMKTEFPDPNDLLNFTLTITPDEGMFSATFDMDTIRSPVAF